MAQKLLRKVGAKRKVAPKKAVVDAPKRIVLVGTYGPRQLEKWPGYYNYPLYGKDRIDVEAVKGVNELWLFSGAKLPRYFAAECLGVKTREELKEFGYKPSGKGHGSGKYLLFKIKKLYAPSRDFAESVTIRTKDFAGQGATQKQLKQYLESPDRKDPLLAKMLPRIVTELPRERLRVCEAAVQLDFFWEMRNDSSEDRVVKWGERPVAIDLFAGCGGLSLGFEQAGFDIAAAVEIDPIHAAVHEYNFPYSRTICADIKNVSGDQIRNLSSLGGRDVDVVFGGAPCQGFSMIGKRALDDPRNQLIKHYLRIVNDIRPKFCVLENVKGLTVGKHVKFLKELICELQKIKYNVLLPYRVLNAADYGVPQNRERLFLIAAREDQTLPAYPEAVEEKTTIRDAIEDLPDADRFDCLLSDDSADVKWRTRSEYGRRLRGLADDDNDFGYRRICREGCLTASRRTIHTEETQRRFLAAPQGETEPHSRFFKLSWEGQSNTLRAGTDSARGGFTSPRPIHPVLPRVITVREGARVHSYPDWFRFNKTKWHGFREIGNSVPPLLARAVGAEIIKALGIRPEKPIFSIRPGSEALLEFDMGKAAEHFSVSRNVIAQRKRKDNGK